MKLAETTRYLVQMMRYLEMLVEMMRSLVEEMKLAETTRYLVQMMRFLATITLVVMPTSLVRKENTELVKEVARILSYLLFSLSLQSSLYFVTIYRIILIALS